MSIDRYVKVEVCFEMRAREEGPAMDEETLTRLLGQALRHKGHIRIWDADRSRMSLDLPRLSNLGVCRLAEWQPERGTDDRKHPAVAAGA